MAVGVEPSKEWWPAASLSFSDWYWAFSFLIFSDPKVIPMSLLPGRFNVVQFPLVVATWHWYCMLVISSGDGKVTLGIKGMRGDMARRSQGEGAVLLASWSRTQLCVWHIIAHQFSFLREQIGFMVALRTTNYMSPTPCPSSLDCLGPAVMGRVAVLGYTGGSGEICFLRLQVPFW